MTALMFSKNKSSLHFSLTSSAMHSSVFCFWLNSLVQPFNKALSLQWIFKRVGEISVHNPLSELERLFYNEHSWLRVSAWNHHNIVFVCEPEPASPERRTLGGFCRRIFPFSWQHPRSWSWESLWWLSFVRCCCFLLSFSALGSWWIHLVINREWSSSSPSASGSQLCMKVHASFHSAPSGRLISLMLNLRLLFF